MRVHAKNSILLGILAGVLLLSKSADAGKGCDCCPCPCWCECEDTPPPTPVTTMPPVTTTTKTTTVCNETCIDLGFIIDGSSSIGPDNFEIVKDFLKNVVDAFAISPSLTQSALLQFSTIPQIEWDYQDASVNENKDTLLAAIGGLSLLTGFTWMVEGWDEYINNVIPTLRTTPPEGCVELTHAVIFFTDGLVSRRTEELPIVADALLASTNGLVYGVAVGNETAGQLNRTQLEIMAGDPDHVFTVDEFDQLKDILDLFLTMICRDVISTQPPNTDLPPTTTMAPPPGVRKCYCCCPPPIPIGFSVYPYNPACPVDSDSSSSGGSSSSTYLYR